MSESIILKVTSAMIVGGQIAKPGEMIEVTHAEAKDMLHRGKAVLATATDAPEPVEKQPEPQPEPAAEQPGEPEAAAEQPAEAPKRNRKGK
ncbi:hypothetical protein [Microvirga alba]|uniref:Uncharacterized protein n=1 Tax=Microvirga alba TaxID=2791025 RepID=A0A931FSG2_9HYPH|nr:hypothetical protein [Microvirga alba]MBF9235583.1 hypothetical protein [Microvirga alba]